MKNLMDVKILTAGAALAFSGLFAASASAAPVISWDWMSDGGFLTDSATCSNGGGLPPGNCDLFFDTPVGATPTSIPGAASVMTWGDPSTNAPANGEQSGLQSISGASGDGPISADLLGAVGVDTVSFAPIITGAGWFTTGVTTHYNNIIRGSGGFMDSSILRTSFTLTLADGVAVPPLPVGGTTNLDILFDETTNEDTPGECSGPNPQGTACDDIFTVTGSLTPFIIPVMGQLYKVSFQLEAGTNAARIGNSIYTAEDNPGWSQILLQARIDPFDVPVPGVLALMGMGLMTIGWSLRGRKLA